MATSGACDPIWMVCPSRLVIRLPLGPLSPLGHDGQQGRVDLSLLANTADEPIRVPSVPTGKRAFQRPRCMGNVSVDVNPLGVSCRPTVRLLANCLAPGGLRRCSASRRTLPFWLRFRPKYRVDFILVRPSPISAVDVRAGFRCLLYSVSSFPRVAVRFRVLLRFARDDLASVASEVSLSFDSDWAASRLRDFRWRWLPIRIPYSGETASAPRNLRIRVRETLGAPVCSSDKRRDDESKSHQEKVRRKRRHRYNIAWEMLRRGRFVRGLILSLSFEKNLR